MSTTKPFSGFNHIYVLRGATDEKAFHAGVDIAEDREYSQLLKAEWIPRKALIAKWFLGAPEPGDIIWGGAVEVIMISTRVRKLLEAAKVTGWSTYPVIVRNKAGQICEGFSGLSITGRCGPIDESRGELLRGQPPDTAFPEYRGIYFDESTWDGSDFFCPNDHTVYKFATEAVKAVFADNSIAGIDFTPLTEATWIVAREDVEDEDGHFLNNPYLDQEDRFSVSLHLNQELDPAGFVVSPSAVDPTKEYVVWYPWSSYDPEIGRKARICETFDEAKAFVLMLHAKDMDAIILREHELIWRTPGIEIVMADE